VRIVAEAAALVAEEGFVARPLNKEVPQGVCGGVAAEAEVLSRPDKEGGIGLTVGVVADGAAAYGHRPVNVGSPVLLLVTLAAEL
jgi:hypothetical protein